MTSDTLKYLKKEQTDIYQWMKQTMLLNAGLKRFRLKNVFVDFLLF